MARMLSKGIVLIVLAWSQIIFSTNGELNSSNGMKMNQENLLGEVWQESLDVIRVLWKDCSKKVFVQSESVSKNENFGSVVKCVKRKTLRALDRMLSSDIISLSPGVQLVKYEIIENHSINERNETSKAMSDADYENGDWKYDVLNRMAKVFNTHVLKLNFHDIENEGKTVESRHRRRQQHMLQMMIFGVVSMGMILVPMGFQFLAVLGGKALLLAKLALLLSSIQGLKKIATSPINYGLYHADGHIEKRGLGHSSDWKPPTTTKKREEPEESGSEKIQYRYDSESKLWKPEYPAKRSLYGLGNGQNVYTVYPVSPHASIQAIPPYGYYGSSSSGVDEYNQGSPGDIHAEYTIDLPVKPF